MKTQYLMILVFAVSTMALPLEAEQETVSRKDQLEYLNQLANIHNTNGRAKRAAAGNLATNESSFPPISPYIVGGTQATPNSWPWQLLLIVSNSWSTTVCGASLLNNRWIVTAAQCVNGAYLSNIYVYAGVHYLSVTGPYEQARGVSYGIIHPSYNPTTRDYDIALLKLKTPVTITTQVSAVLLPSASWTVASGVYCTTTGWGKTSSASTTISNALNQVSVPMVATSTCNSALYYNGAITPRMVCAGIEGKDSCGGDSGGPLVCKNSANRWVLTGVTSWGYGCALANKPGIYANVAPLVSWINPIIAN